MSVGGEASVPAAPKARRWYDHDPVLLEVLDLLRDFPDDVRFQAQAFIRKIEAAVGPDTLQGYYDALPKKGIRGNRWYDRDPIVFRAVELLRLVPPDNQREAATKFLEAMKRRGTGSGKSAGGALVSHPD